MTTTNKNAHALVLAAGGVTGIAWELGVLKGLLDAGADVLDADLIVGTSAGATVGAQIACGALDAATAEQLAPAADSKERAAPYDPAKNEARNRALLEKVGGDLIAARRALYRRRRTLVFQCGLCQRLP